MTEILFPRFSEQEYNRRYAEVRRVLEARDLDAVVCYGDRGAPGMLHYLANFPPRWESVLIFPREGDPVLFIQLYNHLPNARSVSVIADTRWGGVDSIQTVAEDLQRRGLATGSLGLAGAVPYQRFAALQRTLPGLEFVDLSRELGRLRWVKSQEELDRMRRAAELTDLAVAALAEGLRPGLRECGLPALMQAAVGSQGGQLDLCYLASTPMEDPATFVPAQNLSGRQIQTGDIVITEIGAAWEGYAGQIHRPLAVGRAPNRVYLRLFEVALEAYQAVVETIRPGATAQDVLDAADLIHEKGYSIYDDLVHGFGGGYLPPILRTRQTTHGPVEPFVFQKDMCIVVQPNIITPDCRMGLQLGQLHRVTEGGLESLHSYPLEFRVIE